MGTSDYESNMAGFIEKATIKIQVSGDTLKVMMSVVEELIKLYMIFLELMIVLFPIFFFSIF